MKRVSLLLRLAVAIPFLYAGVDGLQHPENWRGYMPPWALDFTAQIPGRFDGESAFLAIFAVFEIVLAVWLITGVRVRLAAMTAAFILFAITVSNLGQFSVVFRDVGLFFAALALIALEKK